MRNLVLALTLSAALPVFGAPITDATFGGDQYPAWADAVTAAGNLTIEALSPGDFVSDPEGGDGDFNLGWDLEHDGSWGNDTWTYTKPMYAFGIAANMDAGAQLLGISNGVASLYLPEAFESNPPMFFGFTSSTPFTQVEIAEFGPRRTWPDGSPYPGIDFQYRVTAQALAYDPPVNVPEPMSFWLCGAGLLAVIGGKRALRVG